MHPCQFKVPGKDKISTFGGHQIRKTFRMCGKKAITARRVKLKYKWDQNDHKTICFCSAHAPNMNEGHSFYKAIMDSLGNATHIKDVIDQGEVPVDSVRDSRIENGIDHLVDDLIRFMSVKKNIWVKDEHWQEIFDRAMIERKVREVVNS